MFMEFMTMIINTISDIEDNKLNRDFYKKLAQTEIHRHIFTDSLLNEKTITKSLRLINVLFRYLGEGNNTLDYIAVQGLPKLKAFIHTSNKDLILQIILLVAHLARTKIDYYPNIHQLSIIKVLPACLRDRSDIKIASLKLLGNLLKHSSDFMEQLSEISIFELVTTDIELHEAVVIPTQLAIANASHFKEQKTEVVEPLLKCMLCLLVPPETETDVRALDAIISLRNFLRHSNKHLPLVFKYKVLQKVFWVLDQVPRNPQLVNAGIKLIHKMVESGEEALLKHHSKEEILKLVNKIKPRESKDAFTKMANEIREKLSS